MKTLFVSVLFGFTALLPNTWAQDRPGTETRLEPEDIEWALKWMERSERKLEALRTTIAHTPMIERPGKGYREIEEIAEGARRYQNEIFMSWVLFRFLEVYDEFARIRELRGFEWTGDEIECLNDILVSSIDRALEWYEPNDEYMRARAQANLITPDPEPPVNIDNLPDDGEMYTKKLIIFAVNYTDFILERLRGVTTAQIKYNLTWKAIGWLRYNIADPENMAKMLFVDEVNFLYDIQENFPERASTDPEARTLMKALRVEYDKNVRPRFVKAQLIAMTTDGKKKVKGLWEVTAEDVERAQEILAQNDFDFSKAVVHVVDNFKEQEGKNLVLSFLGWMDRGVINRPINISGDRRTEGRSLLHFAVRVEWMDLAWSLLGTRQEPGDEDIDLAVYDTKGFNVLMRATAHGKPDFVRRLFEIQATEGRDIGHGKTSNGLEANATFYAYYPPVDYHEEFGIVVPAGAFDELKEIFKAQGMRVLCRDCQD